MENHPTKPRAGLYIFSSHKGDIQVAVSPTRPFCIDRCTGQCSGVFCQRRIAKPSRGVNRGVNAYYPRPRLVEHRISSNFAQ